MPVKSLRKRTVKPIQTEPRQPKEIKPEKINDRNPDSIVSQFEFDGRWTRSKYADAIHMESFYQKMKKDNRIESAQDETYLTKLARINLEMDISMEAGDWDKFDKLGKTFSKFMGDAKLRSMDKTEADRVGGLRSFGQIYAEVEKDGFIPPWKEYAKINGARQDIIDKTIMHIENFTLKLNKVSRMISPPNDCPKLEDFEVDNSATFTDVGISQMADELQPELGDEDAII